jgi:hypothetical protein
MNIYTYHKHYLIILFLVRRIGKFTGLLIPRSNALLVRVQDEEHLTKDKKVLDEPDKKIENIS